MFSADNVLAILAMACATYLTRVSGLVLGQYLPASGPMKRALDALPMAVLTAVIAPAALSGRPEMIAAAVTVLIAARLPVMATIVIAMAVCAGARYLLG